MRKFVALLILLSASGLSAQDVLPNLRVQNSGGTLVELRDVKLMHVEPDGVRVSHAGGIAKVPYERLPVDLQEKYGFSSDKAKEHRDAVTAATAQQVAAAKQAAEKQAVAVSPIASYAATAQTYQPTQQTYSAPNLLHPVARVRTPRVSSRSSYLFSRSYPYTSSCSPYGSCGSCSSYSTYGSYYYTAPTPVSSGSVSAGIR
jgi:hypothetical protein